MNFIQHKKKILLEYLCTILITTCKKDVLRLMQSHTKKLPRWHEELKATIQREAKHFKNTREQVSGRETT